MKWHTHTHSPTFRVRVPTALIYGAFHLVCTSHSAGLIHWKITPAIRLPNKILINLGLIIVCIYKLTFPTELTEMQLVAVAVRRNNEMEESLVT